MQKALAPTSLDSVLLQVCVYGCMSVMCERLVAGPVRYVPPKQST